MTEAAEANEEVEIDMYKWEEIQTDHALVRAYTENETGRVVATVVENPVNGLVSITTIVTEERWYIDVDSAMTAVEELFLTAGKSPDA